MRWPSWLHLPGGPGRAASDDGRDAPSDDAAPGGGAPAEAGPPAVPVARPTGAWQHVAPVQRAVSDAPLTAPALPFARALATQHPPEPMIQPLGHDVLADGPGGLVGGLARPLAMPLAPASPGAAAGASGNAPLPAPRAVDGSHAAGRPGQRITVSRAALPTRRDVEPAALPNDVADPSGSVGSWDSGASAISDVVPRFLPEAQAEPELPLVATRVADGSAPEPVRPTAVVAMDAPSSGSSAGMATSAVGGPMPSTSGGETAGTADGPAGIASGTGAGAAATGPAGGLPLAHGSGSALAAGAAVQRQALGSDDGPDGAAAAPASPTRRTLGESRRLGLGAPLAAKPAPGSPPGIAGPGALPDLPVARSARRGEASAPSGPGPGAFTSPEATVPPTPRPATAATGALPVLHAVQRAADGLAAGAAGPVDGAQDLLNASAGEAGADTRPLVGAPGRALTAAPDALDAGGLAAGAPAGTAGTADATPGGPGTALPMLTVARQVPGLPGQASGSTAGDDPAGEPAGATSPSRADEPAATAPDDAAADHAPSPTVGALPVVARLVADRSGALTHASSPATLGLPVPGGALPVVARLAAPFAQPGGAGQGGGGSAGRASVSAGAPSARVSAQAGAVAGPGPDAPSLGPGGTTPAAGPLPVARSTGGQGPAAAGAAWAGPAGGDRGGDDIAGAPAGAPGAHGGPGAGSPGSTAAFGSPGAGVDVVSLPVVARAALGQPLPVAGSAGRGAAPGLGGRPSGGPTGAAATAGVAGWGQPGAVTTRADLFGDAAADGPAERVLGWTASDGFTTAPPFASVQRAVTIDEMQVSAAPEQAGPGGPGGGGAGPAGGGGAGAGGDVDELADQVYDRIRGRLATELLLDRERAGLLADW